MDLAIYVGSVPSKHLDTFDERLKASLLRIIEEGIDMDRMSMVIDRDERQASGWDSFFLQLGLSKFVITSCAVYSNLRKEILSHRRSLSTSYTVLKMARNFMPPWTT